jgi:lipopolysaccharide/colanic/teichoic acid biosynthesis glycosyltransferase
VNYRLKRAFDLLLTAPGFLAGLPVMLVIALAVKLDSPGPVLFRQARVGQGGRPFTMLKFRTMRPDAEDVLATLQHLNLGGAYMIKIPNDPRITRVGRVLRKSGLDELPQLWNVLLGAMSLVGPRPQVPKEVALYTEADRRRLTVPPGLTGLWQVTARDDPSFERLVALDLTYIDHWSLWLDVSILLRTFGAMRLGEGEDHLPPELAETYQRLFAEHMGQREL